MAQCPIDTKRISNPGEVEALVRIQAAERVCAHSAQLDTRCSPEAYRLGLQLAIGISNELNPFADLSTEDLHSDRWHGLSQR